MSQCCNCCGDCERKKVRNEKEYKDLIHRLKRIEGQVRLTSPSDIKELMDRKWWSRNGTVWIF